MLNAYPPHLLLLGLLHIAFWIEFFFFEQQTGDWILNTIKMPRYPDIGWEHGKMVGGQRHHVQCNYCHRTMIGGITRFKKHLASKSGEIKGCEAVPKEVKETIRKHLATLKPKKAVEKKQRRTSYIAPPSTTQNMDSDGSDAYVMNAKPELLTFREGEAHCMHSFIVLSSISLVKTFFYL